MFYEKNQSYEQNQNIHKHTLRKNRKKEAEIIYLSIDIIQIFNEEWKIKILRDKAAEKLKLENSIHSTF